MLPVLLGFAALTVDIGVMHNARTDLQTVADAAALAAVAMLNEYGTIDEPTDPFQLARIEARKFAALNKVLGQPIELSDSDIQFGTTSYSNDSNTYTFVATAAFPNSVRVTARKTADSPNGAVELFFARIFGAATTNIHASAGAILIPRDIIVVADLSGSTSFDSQLRHYDLPEPFEIDPFSIWAALPIAKGNAGVGNGDDPPPPGNPNSENDQPGSGPGSPANAGGNPNPGAEPYGGGGETGPRWGWMTAFGANLYPKADYSPADDVGLYYIPKGAETTDADVIENLNQAGYSPDEQAALLNAVPGQNYDTSNSAYRRRVNVLLGLAGWRSKQAGSKFNGGPGDGDNRVEENELWQEVDYPFDVDNDLDPAATPGNWNDYINYVKSSSSTMNTDDANFRYQYGLKTFVDYLLVKKAGAAETPDLANVPSQPLQAIKDGVTTMVDRLASYETSDQLGLVVYATDSTLEVPMGLVYNVDAGVLNTSVADRLNEMQPAHYHLGYAYTNIHAGIVEAMAELSSGNERSGAGKSIVILTDGNANYSLNNSGAPVSGSSNARTRALGAAEEAASLGFQVHTISVGGNADAELMEEIAQIGSGTWSHAEGTIEQYTAQLQEIFAQLAAGGARPITLME